MSHDTMDSTCPIDSSASHHSNNHPPSDHRDMSATSSASTSTPAKRRSARFVNVAPLNTPLRHRLQTFGVLWHCMTLPFFVCLFLITLSLGWVVWISILVPYFVWWYGFDLHTPTNGKVVYRTRSWLKNLVIFHWFASYFPILVHKTCELEPTFTEVPVDQGELSDDEQDLISETSRTYIDKVFKKLGLNKRLNTESYSPPSSTGYSGPPVRRAVQKYTRITTGPRYIFGYHPHGVISMGVMGLFATNVVRNEPYKPPLSWLKPLFHDSSKGARALPGIGTIFPLTLTTQFAIPFFRDYILALGITSASAKNIKSLISNGDNSICIVVGGAQESLLNSMVTGRSSVGYGYVGEAHEAKQMKQIRLVLRRRKGFVKIAIELGNVSLVPTFAFGEADIYRLNTPEPGSWGSKLQRWLKDTFQFTLPFFSARGVFIYDFGILPYRHPIDICMGRPIHIPVNAVETYYAEHPQDIPERENEKDYDKDKNEQSPEGVEIIKPQEQSPEELRQRRPHQDQSFDNSATVQSESESQAGDPPRLHPESHSQSLMNMTGLSNMNILHTGSLTNLFGSKEKKPLAAKSKKIPAKVLDYYHALYIEELKRVFEDNKNAYGYGDVELVIED